ncbi:MAG: hypothetical protein NTV00_15330, partial [Methylococcales bacterium]|nr:hypothetical protein [Methylococcales bacterium]
MTLDKASNTDTVIKLSAPAGSATAGTDYSGDVPSVTIPKGLLSATVTIDPTADSTVEADETVILSLATGAGYTVGKADTATGTISNDDVPVASIAVSADVAEDGATNLVYTVTLDKASNTDTVI